MGDPNEKLTFIIPKPSDPPYVGPASSSENENIINQIQSTTDWLGTKKFRPKKAKKNQETNNDSSENQNDEATDQARPTATKS